MNYTKPKTGWKLLGTSSAKTQKGEKFEYTTYIMYLAPAVQNSKGIDLCPMRSKGCTKACLFTSGRGKFTTVEKARVNKTEFYVNSRHQFLHELFEQVHKIVRRHKKAKLPKDMYKKFCIRLNGTSDINFLRQKIDGKNIYETFPDIQFYDYTKNHFQLLSNSYDNYHITFSRDETNEETAVKLISDGFNAAFVFEKYIPKTYKGYTVLNGDETDLRFLDKRGGYIIGLKYKKSKDNEPNEFVIKQ